jgi:polysaccharide export outer membrane protein
MANPKPITIRIAACALAGAALFHQALRASDSEAGASSQGSERGSPSLPFPLSSVVGDDYQLEPFDLVVFQVFNEPDVGTEQRISAAGDIRLPMVGSVNLRGLSVRAAEQRLEELYRSGGFYKDPQVILFVARHSERAISVIGQVNRPDRIEMPVGTEEMGLAQAVAMTGGLTRIARASAIQVSRIGPDGREERFTVDLDAYLNAGKSGREADFQLKPDDVVFVPERKI